MQSHSQSAVRAAILWAPAVHSYINIVIFEPDPRSRSRAPVPTHLAPSRPLLPGRTVVVDWPPTHTPPTELRASDSVVMLWGRERERGWIIINNLVRAIFWYEYLFMHIHYHVVDTVVDDSSHNCIFKKVTKVAPNIF